MSWLSQLFGFKEDLAERYARDYTRLVLWDINLEKDWHLIENEILLKLEQTGTGG